MSALPKSLPLVQPRAFRSLERVPLNEAVTRVKDRHHPELQSVARHAAQIFESLLPESAPGNAATRAFVAARKRFFDSLHLHLDGEARDVLRRFDLQSAFPDEETIARMRKEHNQLLESLDILEKSVDALEAESAGLSIAIRKARGCIGKLDAALNAEIFVEETGVLRRCLALRRGRS